MENQCILISQSSWDIINKSKDMLEVISLRRSCLPDNMVEICYKPENFRKVIDIFHSVGYSKGYSAGSASGRCC